MFESSDLMLLLVHMQMIYVYNVNGLCNKEVSFNDAWELQSYISIYRRYICDDCQVVGN